MMWTILNADGSVAYPCLFSDVHPSDPASGWAWETGQNAIEITTQPVPGQHVWDGSEWVVDLAWARAQKIAVINSIKDIKQSGPANTPFGLIDNDDEKSKGRLNGAATMALVAKTLGQPFSITWTMHDNSEVTLDADQMIAMGTAAGEYVARVQDFASSLKAQVNAAITVADLDAIDIEGASWPT